MENETESCYHVRGSYRAVQRAEWAIKGQNNRVSWQESGHYVRLIQVECQMKEDEACIVSTAAGTAQWS